MKTQQTLFVIVLSSSTLFATEPAPPLSYVSSCEVVQLVGRDEDSIGKWKLTPSSTLQVRNGVGGRLVFAAGDLQKAITGDLVSLRLTVKRLSLKPEAAGGSVEIRIGPLIPENVSLAEHLLLSEEASLRLGAPISKEFSIEELSDGKTISVEFSLNDVGGIQGLERGILIMATESGREGFGDMVLGASFEGPAAGIAAPSLKNAK